MEVIEDLGTDVALALLVDGKHLEQIGADQAMNLIGKIRNALEPGSGVAGFREPHDAPKTASA